MKYEPITPDAYFHIYNCGNNKENLFIEEDNYIYFLSLIKKHLLNSMDLIKNHFHLIVKTKPDTSDNNLSRSFSNLFNAYAKAINKRYHRSGSLFKDQFSRIKIEDETYLQSIIIYVHTNPTHHGFTTDFRTYKYSSYHSMTSKKPTELDREFVLSLFDDRKNFEFVHQSKNTSILEKYILE
ncbi:transposase [Paucihalobacter ruber]|uniref:Transposase n=1 Tax=Paucihalobacter ruber TaxID=2567861 RepID=A0A506PHN3_9FLAO|nr:transposase [Paucihalobacter ruber]TPV31880.1 transposase [Paucihalobacter ruber]